MALENDLEFVLGYKSKLIGEDNPNADYIPVLDRGIFSFFIYTNLVTETIVGDSRVKLLRSIHVRSIEYNKIHNQIIQDPVYVEFSMKSFQNVEIKLCDTYGSKVPLKNTKIHIKLGFIRL